ncbi:Glutamate 5-kinase [Nostocoides japonicum T1-X7]|uniref:Glutamate 5-kinase n=1 Tax=Nostocoides japonicum T1-X7 TaxID=1194083 RepID=A0A077M165_9MICO|nr:glutamate 5-kinase [Tetrasphaera japonica]CCH80078.1 Glutamate 5-kinase [Tetrasphaera japonica T1-X7]
MTSDTSDVEVAAPPHRGRIATAQRVVVKVGSSSLTGAGGGRLHRPALDALVDALAARRLTGSQVLLVSSGAIAAGLGPLGLAKRPWELAMQQAAASVGQGALLAAYQDAFARHGLTVGQVLLTADDVTRRSHYTNAKRTFDRLLELGIVPVVNENDTVATQEIRFGDNDRLAALVSHLVGADALVLLTDVDALYDGAPRRAGSRRVPLVATAADLDDIEIGGTGSAVGSGGMLTKVEAASIAGAAGIPTLLTSAEQVVPGLAGADVGTVFAPSATRRASRKLWLAHATTARGRLVIDEGAVRALTHRRTSLLPAGVVAIEGSFGGGDAVDVCGPDGTVVARGLVNYASAELPKLLGRSTRELARAYGPEYEREVIHRDDLVIL